MQRRYTGKRKLVVEKEFMEPLSRRFVLKGLSAGVALAVHTPLVIASRRTMPELKQAATFIEHNDLPWALETRRSQFGFGPITPTSHFFVRNNLPLPPAATTAQGDQWAFEVAGCARPGRLTLGQLKGMATQTVASVLQCSGNGRAFFPHQPSGSQWGVGAAGCALWTGVRVREVFEHFGGVIGNPSFLTATGGEELPQGVDRDTVVVERSVPIGKGLEDCLLAWEMNGAPITPVHGGPLRLIVPGYFGVNNVKWLRQIAATTQESSAKIQQSGYRFRPQGEPGGPDYPSMWRMPVKSWLNGPGADGAEVLAGSVTLYGVAFSGERGVSTVDISGDGGQSWQRAQLVGPDLGPNAWRTFSFQTTLSVGEHRFVSRAVDRAGEQQPRAATDNHRGYGHNGWDDHALVITAVATLPESQRESGPPGDSLSVARQQPQTETRVLSEQALLGKDVFMAGAQPGCGVCHSLQSADARGVVGPNLDKLKPGMAQVRSAVSQGVGAMPAYGGQLTSAEIEALAAYVVESTQ